MRASSVCVVDKHAGGELEGEYEGVGVVPPRTFGRFPQCEAAQHPQYVVGAVNWYGVVNGMQRCIQTTPQFCHQSLRPCEGTMMLNIDVAATTFYKGQPLVTYASQILFPLGFKRRDGPPPKQKGMVPKLDERQKKMLEKELKSVKIETTHGEHRRHYKIAKLTNYTARTHKFETDEGTTTVQKYFETKYRIRLRFPDLPLVLMLPREKNIQLPMELCYVLGGEHYKKKLDPQGTSDMVRSCAKPAPDRAKIIDNYARTNNYSGDQTIQDFNLRVDNKMVELTVVN